MLTGPKNREARAFIRRLSTARLSGALFALILLVGAAVPVASQSVPASITGRMTDSNGTPIGDVTVSLEVPGGERRSLTDATGAYRFAEVPAGTFRLRAQRPGFLPEAVQVTTTAGQTVVVDLILRAQPLVLEGVTAQALSESLRERERFETDPGITARVVEARTLKLLPGLGEADVLRAIELLPGVVSTSDFSSSFNVRGGSADQNLILIDGFTVFNPVHLGGLFSVFNSDAVERAELFAGGFGAEFGGRVSSVLNIESRNDRPEGIEVAGGVSMLATRALVRGPMPGSLERSLGAEGSWFISGRRSYFDQLLRPVAEFPYHLTDLQGHAAFLTPGGSRLTFTGYWGEDVLDLSNLGNDGDAAAALRLRWNWGNQVAGVRLERPIFNGWTLDTRAGYSRFAERLGFADFGDVNFQSRVEQQLWRGDLRRALPGGSTLKLGVAADRLVHFNLAEAGGTSFFDTRGKALLGSTYASLQWRPDSVWIAEPGLRLDAWRSGGFTRVVVAPRFAIKRFLGVDRNVAFKLAVGRYTQFLHSLRDEELPVSNDTWVLADENVPAIISDQAQAGIEGFWGAGWSASAEAYTRSFEGVTELNLAENPNDLTDDLLEGEGRSYGLDLMLRRDFGPLTGWTSLSLLRATRTFPDPLAEGWEDLPQTVSFPPIFDRRVNFDLVAQYETRDGLQIGAHWNYGSGLPYTRPVAQYFSWRHHPIWGRAEPFSFGFGEDDGDIPVAIVLGRRNSERYPSYHRLDLTFRKEFTRGWGSYVPYLQILNLYNRKNVLFYFYDYDDSPPVRSGFSMFPFLPALGIEVTF